MSILKFPTPGVKMKTFTIALPTLLEQLNKAGIVNVEKIEIETVLAAVLTQYIKDGWAREVLASEFRELRAGGIERYKQDAGTNGQ